MGKLELLFFVSLMVNFLFMFSALFISRKMGGVSYAMNRLGSLIKGKQISYYEGKTSIFALPPIEKGGVVFLGDSITDHAEWSEFFPHLRVFNRGISGDTTNGVLSRLDNVTSLNPQSIFLMVGINDLSKGNNLNQITSNFSNIVNIIKNSSPNTQIYVQSVLPVNNKKIRTSFTNDTVAELNENLKLLSEKNGLTYVDLYHLFAKDNQLREEYTTDGVHLNGNAYETWKGEISKYLN